MDSDRSDLRFAMTNRTDPPSYVAQLAKGATSRNEAWDADPLSSQNHCMLGHIEERFYGGLASIETDLDHITIRPQPVGDLAWVKACHDTAPGRVGSSWRKDVSGFELTVKIPPNATATVFLPGRSRQGITENGRPVSGAEDVRHLRQEGSALLFEVASDQYDFRVRKL